MLDTSARLLHLLSLLQSRRDWTGLELAERLGVSGRTVRNDIERLRDLGYPVPATRGAAGGYRLGAGAKLPPLLLDDDEAVAVAIGLGTAASSGVAGIDEASLRALVKLEQVLPARLRHRVSSLHAAVTSIPSPEPAVAADVLTAIAGAVRDQVRLRFDYLDHDGRASRRETEPHQIAHTGYRWYLVAWDVDRGDWRTFRVDRIRPRVPTGPRFTPRPPPDGDLAGYLARSIGTALMRYRARVRVHAPATEIAPFLPPAVQVTPLDARSCLILAGSETPRSLAVYLAMLDADFEVIDAPEIAEELARLADRFHRAISPGTAGS